MDSFHDITAGLRERIYIIHRRRWVLITILVIIFTVTAIANFAATPLYQAASRIRIESQMPDVVPFQDHRAISSGRQLDYYNTQYRMLKSPSLARMVRDNLPAEAAEDLSPDRLLSMVEIKPITQSELVDIVAIGPDPELAALVANTWADQFIRMSIQAKFESVQTALAQLDRQLEAQNQRVLDAQAELMDYKEQERIISLEDVEKQLSRLSEDYSAIRQQAEEKELHLQHLAKYQGQDLSLENFPQVRYHSIILQLRNRLVQLQATRGEFSQRYRERHPRMIQLEAEIATVEAALQEEIGKIVEGLKRERDLARDQEEILRRDLEKQKTLFFTMERKIKNIEGLSAKVDIDREVQQALLSRVSEATMTKGIEITNIRVVDYGEVPRQPFKPRKTFNLFLSLIIGTGGGIAAIFFLENLDTSVKTAGEAKKILKIPFLGAIPLYSQVSIRNGLSPLEIMKNPMGLIPEAYRAIRTGIYYASPDSSPRTILVTSSLAQEGKTDVSTLLALSLAQGQERVLLIDADLRKPRIGKIFGANREQPGLSTILSGRAGLDEAVRPTDFPGLEFIPGGRIPPNPAELINSRRFGELLEEARGKWDRIIIDSPPLLSVTDAVIIGRMVDGVVMVLRAGDTRGKVAAYCREKLEHVNARLIGLILNRADIHRGENYYYQSYYA